MNRYFQRTELLTGEEGFKKLTKASAAVIGLGGVGSYAAEAIARSGIGNITIVDHDQIEETNLNRQLPALLSTIGKYKADIVAARIRDINPVADIRKFTCAYNEGNSNDILKPPIDYVIDAIDSFNDKVHLIKTCYYQQIPVISSMGMANRLNPQLLKIADIKDTSICPMARKLRRELRKEDIYTGVTVVYSCEEPIKTEYNGDTRLGSVAFVTGTAGLLLASHVVNFILSRSD